MAIIKNTPRFLNTDGDQRIVQATEMLNALNIRITSDDNGNSGVVKNMKGNQRVANDIGDSTPLATNTIVGAYEHEGTNRFFVFVYSSLGTHSVYELGQTGGFTKIIESGYIEIDSADSILQINGMVIDDELHLYFTDGIEQPQKVNVDTTETVGTYPASHAECAVQKKAPLAPLVEFSTEPSRTTNDIIGKSFQFAFQYVYRDGEVSAIGEYSANYCSPNTLKEGADDSDEYINQFNKITVTLDTNVSFLSLTSTVSAFRLYFKDVDDNTMYYVGEYNYTNAAAGLGFYNDGGYAAVSDAEFNKLADAVPRTAQAQTITANRLFYGNYNEGFDYANTSSVLGLSYSAEFSPEDLPETDDGTGTTNTVTITTDNALSLFSGDDVYVDIDFAISKHTFTETATKTIDIVGPSGTVHATTVADQVRHRIPRTRIVKSVTISAPTSQADFNTKLAAALDGVTITQNVASNVANQFGSGPSSYQVWWEGSVTLELDVSTIASGITINPNVSSYNLSTSRVDLHDGTSYVNEPNRFAYTSENSVAGGSYLMSGSPLIHRQGSVAYADMASRTFKSGESHSFGIVFEDAFGRTSGVREVGSLTVPELGVRNIGERGPVDVDITVFSSGLDSDLTKFFYVYSGGNTVDDYIQYSVTEALVADATSDTLYDSDSIFVSLRALQGKAQSYNDKGADLTYTFAEGDKVRIISYVDPTTGERVYPINHVFDVVGVYNTDTAGELDSGTLASTFVETGEFLVLKDRDLEGFQFSTIDTTDDLWQENVIIEVFTPKKEQEQKVYKAISGKYDIADLGTTHTLTEGNAWYKSRVLRFRGTGNGLSPEVHFLESKQYTDKDSTKKGFLGGKPYGVIKSEREENRISSITYSDPQLADSAQLNLSSFNNSLANWMDYEMNYGGIYGLVDMSDSIMVLQSDKVSRVPVSRQILSTGSGSQMVTQSTDILGLQQHYPANFGINADRAAFCKVDGDVYLVDVTRSKLVKIGSNGVQELNSLGVDSWIDTRTKSMLEDVDGYHVSIGNDRENGEIVFSLQNKPVGTYSDVLVYSKGLERFSTTASYGSYLYGNLGNRFLHIRGNDVWQAELSSTYSNFFGTQEEAFFEVSFNQSPSVSKVFQALSIEGTVDAEVSLSTQSQSVTVDSAAFEEKEDEWFAKVGRAAGSSEFIVLGQVSVENDPYITFSNKINRLPFRLNGEAYEYDGTNYVQYTALPVVTGLVDANTIELDYGGDVSVGDIVAIKGESTIDGDAVRGVYGVARFTFDDTEEIEVFAVNASVAQSSLHNGGVSQQ